MTIAAVKASLLGKFQSLSSVAVVSGYNVSPWPSYPGASLTAVAGEGSFLSTHHNERVRMFDLMVFVAADASWTPKQTEDLSVSVLDEIEMALDRDTTLSGLVSAVTPVSWESDYEIRESQVHVLTISIGVREVLLVR